jgi:tetratricopeptide (TPR) repeat protein
LFKKLKEYDNAITQYKKAIELNPMLIVAYNNLGLVYIIQSKYDTAKSILLEALEYAPDDYEINANLTSIAVKENNHLLIDSFATKALSLLPDEYDNLDLLDIRGNARLMLGRPQDALYDYLSILKQLSKEEEKNNASIFSNAAYCYIEMNHYDEAIQYFEKTLEYDKSVDAAIGLMITYYKLKDTKKLNDAKAKAYELEPLLKDGIKGIEKLEADGYFYTESQKDILKRILK